MWAINTQCKKDEMAAMSLNSSPAGYVHPRVYISIYMKSPYPGHIAKRKTPTTPNIRSLNMEKT